MASSALEEHPPAEKKQKLEKDDSQPYIEVEIDEEREMTEEESKIYCKAVAATDGFDVPDFPNVEGCGMIVPLSVNEDTLEYLLPYSKAAIKVYNRDNETEYEVVQVEKAMNQAVCGLKYYITFQAKLPADDATKTFEAPVLRGIPKYKGDEPIQVIFCREKGTRTIREKSCYCGDKDEEMEAQNRGSASVEEEGEGA